MQRSVKLILLALILLFLSPHLTAQDEPKWESHGPYGGMTFSIQVDQSNPKRLLVRTTGGNFLSTDAGSTWKRIMPPKGAFYCRHITLICGKFYCGHEKGLYISNDGVSWEKKGEFAGDICDITCEPGRPEKMWCILIKYQPAELYAAKKDGEKWKIKKIADLPKSQTGGWSFSLIISPNNPSVLRVFVTFWEPKEKTWVYGSDDGGKTWDNWLTDAVPSPATFSATESKTIYGAAWKHPGKISGLFKSKDGGKTWKSLSSDKRVASLRSLMLHPKTGHLYLGSTDSGLFKTTDEGNTLIGLNKGLHNKNVTAIAADPTNESVLYAATQWGIFKSIDGGKNWKWISKGIAGCQVTGIVIFDGKPDTICVFEFHQGPRNSTDGTKTWSKPSQTEGLLRRTYQTWCKGNKIFARASTEKGYATLLSSDMGKTWKHIKELREKDWPISIISDNEMYAVRNYVSLLKSTDGMSWKPFAGPFDEVGDLIMWIGRPEGKKYLVVGGKNRILLCDSESGKRVASVKVPEDMAPLLWPWVFDTSEIEVLYVGNSKHELLKCDLLTREWTKLKPHKEIKEYTHITGIVFDPGKKRSLFISYSDGYLAQSEDSGRTWRPFKPELPFFEISRMAVTANRKLVVAGNGTVYTLDLSKIK